MNPRLRRIALVTAVAAAAAALQGCAAMSVKPWDRDLMAKPTMRFVPRPLETAVDDHIYFSREGSTGGMDVAGGGCGCN